MDINCIVLAGGKSSRLGRSKLMEKVGSRNLLERVISRLVYFKGKIIIVKAHDSVLPELKDYPGLKIVEDILPGRGALGGLFSGLKASDRLYNLAIACDMPFINLDLCKHLISLSENYDAVVPVFEGNSEPLHAIYSRNCLPIMQHLIEQNKLSILGLFPMIKVKFVNKTEIDKLDPRHLSFFNINTEAELETGRIIAEQEDSRIDKRRDGFG